MNLHPLAMHEFGSKHIEINGFPKVKWWSRAQTATARAHPGAASVEQVFISLFFFFFFPLPSEDGTT